MRYAEHDEQVALFRRAAYRKYNGGTVRDVIYAVPNAGTTGGRRAAVAGVRRKAEGVTPGVPDVECFVAVAPFTGLHIEMKRVDGKPSDVTESQKTMIARLRKYGRKCQVCYGQEQAWAELCEYLGVKP